MFRHSNPQNFGPPSGGFGRVSELRPTDERNQPIRVPRTVEEANGMEPEATPTEATPVAPATIEIRMMPFAQILVALLDLQRTEPRAAELYHTLIDSETEINQLLSSVREAELTRLRVEHERVLGECRTTVARIAELEQQLPAIEALLRRRQSETSPLRAALKSVRDAKPSTGFPRYATAQDVEAWSDSVDEAQSRLARAEQSESVVVDEYNGIVAKIGAQRELLNGHRANTAALSDYDRPGLVEQEQRLRAQIEGRPWTDSFSGLKSTTAILT